jgi:hypothetical protein
VAVLISKTYAPGGNSSLSKGANTVSRASQMQPQQEHSMLDVVMLALGLSFFALSVGYAYACERL